MNTCTIIELIEIVEQVLAPFDAEQPLLGAVREEPLDRREHQAGDEQVHDEEIEPEEDAPVARFLRLDVGAAEQRGGDADDQRGQAERLARAQQQAEQRQRVGREQHDVDRDAEAGQILAATRSSGIANQPGQRSATTKPKPATASSSAKKPETSRCRSGAPRSALRDRRETAEAAWSVSSWIPRAVDRPRLSIITRFHLSTRPASISAYTLAGAAWRDSRPTMTTLHTAASFGAAFRRLIDHLDSALEQAYCDDGLDFRPHYTPVIRALMDDGPHTLTAAGRTPRRLAFGDQPDGVADAARRVGGRDPGEDDARQRIVALSRLAKAMQPRLEEHWRAARVATAALDTETGGVLVEVINRANAALARWSFGDRLADARHPTASQTGNRIPAA